MFSSPTSLKRPLPLSTLACSILPVLLLLLIEQDARRPNSLTLDLNLPLVELLGDIKDDIESLGEADKAILGSHAEINVNIIHRDSLDLGEGRLDILTLGISCETGEGNDTLLLPLHGLNYEFLLRSRLGSRAVAGSTLFISIVLLPPLVVASLLLVLLVLLQPLRHGLHGDNVVANLDLLSIRNSLLVGLSGIKLDEKGAEGRLDNLELGVGLTVARASNGNLAELVKGSLDIIDGDGEALGDVLLLGLRRWGGVGWDGVGLGLRES